jgi:nicotinamidase-related amidase
LSKALVVVDVQVGMFFGPWALPDAANLLHRIGDRILAARQAGELVVHIQNDGPEDELDAPGEPMWELVFSPRESELVVRKTQQNVFESALDLEDRLRALGVSELEFIGVQSELCLWASAKGASERGFEVVATRELHGTFDGGYPGATSGPTAAELSDRVQSQIEALAAN